jgi:hypothetical protein
MPRTAKLKAKLEEALKEIDQRFEVKGPFGPGGSKYYELFEGAENLCNRISIALLNKGGEFGVDNGHQQPHAPAYWSRSIAPNSKLILMTGNLNELNIHAVEKAAEQISGILAEGVEAPQATATARAVKSRASRIRNR